MSQAASSNSPKQAETRAMFELIKSLKKFSLCVADSDYIVMWQHSAPK